MAARPSDRFAFPDLAFSNLKFDGEPGRPASAEELTRQAHALGRSSPTPAHADALPPRRARRASAEGYRPGLARDSVQSVRVARRAAPDGRILFDLVAEVTQSCTSEHGGELFDMNGGCTLIDRPGG